MRVRDRPFTDPFRYGFAGMLLRWFTALYDLNVIEEDAYFQWKEDLTEVYPGKQRALFQVNAWLMWLQEAESEEEEDN